MFESNPQKELEKARREEILKPGLESLKDLLKTDENSVRKVIVGMEEYKQSEKFNISAILQTFAAAFVLFVKHPINVWKVIDMGVLVDEDKKARETVMDNQYVKFAFDKGKNQEMHNEMFGENSNLSANIGREQKEHKSRQPKEYTPSPLVQNIKEKYNIGDSSQQGKGR